MDFCLTPQQELFKRTVREFAEKNIAPRSREIDQKAQGIPEEIIQGMAPGIKAQESFFIQSRSTPVPQTVLNQLAACEITGKKINGLESMEKNIFWKKPQICWV